MLTQMLRCAPHSVILMHHPHSLGSMGVFHDRSLLPKMTAYSYSIYLIGPGSALARGLGSQRSWRGAEQSGRQTGGLGA